MPQPENKEEIGAIGVDLADQGRYEEALRYAEMFIATDSKDARGWGLKGICLFNLGREEEAFTCCKKALGINPQIIGVRYILFAFYYNRGDYENMALLAQETLQFAPENIKARLALAEALMLSDKLRKAKEELDKALEFINAAEYAQSSDMAMVYQARGILCVMRGDKDKAMMEFEKAIKADQREQWFYKLADACLMLDVIGVLIEGTPQERRARLLGYAQQREKTYGSYLEWKTENEL